MKSYTEAYEIIKDEFLRLTPDSEEVNLLDSLGRVNKGNIISGSTLPPFNNSAMDGIVVKHTNGNSQWKIISEISAGNFKQQKIAQGEAALIMTGAKLPQGGDTVIPIEDLVIENNSALLKEGVRINAGQNIRKAGQDLKINELVLADRTTINPRHISLLASCGLSKIKVLEKLNIGILATGDELVDLNDECDEDSIRASNLYSIIALVRDLGMNYVNFGIICDDRELLKDKIKAALHCEIDILITTGGVSVGKFDYVKEILTELACEIVFWKVNIKPGKPLLFAKTVIDGKTKFIFGLPGNPVSSFVNFQLFIRNVLLETYYNTKPSIITARLRNDIIKNDNKRHFIRGIVAMNITDDENIVSMIENQSSSNLTGLSLSNTLITIDEEMKNPKTGNKVECIMI